MKSIIKSDKFVTQEINNKIIFCIVYHIQNTSNNQIEINLLLKKMKDEINLPRSVNTAWTILQVKNKMVEQKLLFMTFDKSHQQKVGLTFKGRRFFEPDTD